MSEEPEFSRLVKLDGLAVNPRAVHIEADQQERLALARRFSLVAIDHLEAGTECFRNESGIFVTGSLKAAVTQTCVASGEAVPATIEEGFNLRFVAEDQLDVESEEIELSESDCDMMFYSGNAIDIGEAVAETLLLALDPFPRSPTAEAALRASGMVVSEEDIGPFAALKALREKFGGDD